MRILQINQCHYKRGGADVVYLNTIDLLKEKGHEVACFSTQNPLNQDSAYSKYFVSSADLRKQRLTKKLIRVKPYLYNKEAYNQLKRLIYDFKPDIAHVHLFYASLSVSIFDALKEFNIPVIHTVHDYRLLCPVSTCLDINFKICEQCAKKNALTCLYKKCSNGSLSQSFVVSLESFFWKHFKNPILGIDYFHFVSDFCRDKHIIYFPEISDKSFVLYNSCSIITEFKNSNDERFFLYFGRLSPEKGIKTLIDVWKKVPKGALLKIVGTGVLNEDIEKEIYDNKLTNVELLGYKTGAELESIIKKASFVIVPSEWYENNPMSIVESFSLGKPVIGANIGGIPELVNHGKNGYVFESKNSHSLLDILKIAFSLTEKEYANLSSSAYSFAHENFAQEVYYKKLINIYNNVILDKTNINKPK